MASKKDKDYHILRNPEKYFGKFHRNAHIFQQGLVTPEIAEAEKKYDKLWSKYGYKSMVGDKRRRNTTRKSNQKFKQTKRQIERARNKQQTQNLIKEYYNDTLEQI